MSTTLIKNGHKVTSTVPTELVNLKAVGYVEYVAPKTKPKAVKPEAPVIIDSTVESKISEDN